MHDDIISLARSGENAAHWTTHWPIRATLPPSTHSCAHSAFQAGQLIDRFAAQDLTQLGGRRCLVPGLMEALVPRKDESHGSTEDVPGRASGAGDPDDVRSAA